MIYLYPHMKNNFSKRYLNVMCFQCPIMLLLKVYLKIQDILSIIQYWVKSQLVNYRNCSIKHVASVVSLRRRSTCDLFEEGSNDSARFFPIYVLQYEDNISKILGYSNFIKSFFNAFSPFIFVFILPNYIIGYYKMQCVNLRKRLNIS